MKKVNPSMGASTTVVIPSMGAVVNPSREETWSENFRLVKEFYDSEGHLTMPRDDPKYLRLTQWLTYQRHQSKGLRKDQLERLDSIHYKDVPIYREDNEKEWLTKLEELKRSYSEGGDATNERSHSIKCWLSRQRRLNRLGLLKLSRKTMLTDCGVSLKVEEGRRNGKSAESVAQRNQWFAKFEQLKQYHQSHGDCNVPKKWKENPVLGTWVFNQRKKYGLMKDGLVHMPEYRIELLEEIGFEWSRRNIRKETDTLRKQDHQQHRDQGG